MKLYLKNRFYLISAAIVVLMILTFSHCTKKWAMVVTQLKCENLNNPIGIDHSHPRFSWIVQSDTRGQKQTAYQILVASRAEILGKNKGDMWDSEKVLSDKTAHISYGGKSLKSNHCYFWKLRAWDKDGIPGPFSDAAKFNTAILDPGDWQAQWIGKGGSKDPVNEKGYYDQSMDVDSEGDSIHYNERSLLLRKEISISKSVQNAIVHISGLGYYELTINGRKIGDKVLSPAKTNYKKIVLYDTYDVTSPLKTGENAIGIMLGNGWFNPLKKCGPGVCNGLGLNEPCCRCISLFQMVPRRSFVPMTAGKSRTVRLPAAVFMMGKFMMPTRRYPVGTTRIWMMRNGIRRR